MPAPGKLGRRPRDISRPAPRFEDYLITGAEAAELPHLLGTQDIDYGTAVAASPGGFPMYCNGPDPANAVACPGSPEGCGNCAWAYWGHAIQSWTLYEQAELVTVSPSAIIAAYADCTGYSPLTGANDNGTELQDALEYMRQTGIPDSSGKVHKIVAYAEVSGFQSQQRVAQVLDLCGTGYVGVNLQQAQEDQFGNEQPWDWEGSPVIGGHAIGLQQRAGSGLSKLRVTTWGALWEATTAFWSNCVEEFWYVVSEDDIQANGTTRAGFNLEQLLADMAKIS
jgi:hypothetical protein